MEKIKSFQVDHRKFGIGMYTSRIDGDITSYDLRFVIPNGGKYLATPSMHTIEHLLATFVRNTKFAESIVYAGPMGCRTGFYLLTKGINPSEVIELVRDALRFISTYEGDIPGVSEEECGNFREHDLVNAKIDVLPLLSALTNYTCEMLEYSWHYNQNC